MPIRKPEEWVELIDEAQAALVAGGVSSYSIAGRNFTKHDLRALQELRSYWESRAAQASGGFTTSPDFSGGGL